jgi:hypothetical protein
MKTQFYINGGMIIGNPKEILAECLTTVDISIWSVEAIKNLIVGSIEMVNLYCQDRIAENKSLGKDYLRENNSKYSAFIRWSRNMTKRLPENRDFLIGKVFNIILSCEGAGRLRGFGMVNRKGDKSMGNPEQTTIYPEDKSGLFMPKGKTSAFI